MANYLLLYSGGAQPGTAEERAASLKEWMDWFGTLGAAVVDGGNPFSGAVQQLGSDAPSLPATGYSVLKADSLTAAVQMAQGCPHLKSAGQVTVFETMNAM